MAENSAPIRVPRGQLVIRTIAMPADTNSAGDVFGGWVMSQMDIGGAILAHQIARCRVTTVAVDAMEFHQPVLVGDTVACFAELRRVGRTSMRIQIEVWVQRHFERVEHCVTEGAFTYVALDLAGRPQPVYRIDNPPPPDPGP
ncbi:MAG TPA: acyl-CoA thioesterase [Opitutaceae bacterium]|nr:acyl-CoA thioesterase [Opitutaceae bacterium]